MSRYFAFVGDEVYDYSFKKSEHLRGWYFYLGTHLICQLVKSKLGGWSVIVYGDDVTAPRLVYGFISRHRAIDYALKVHPLTRDRYNK